MKPEVLLSVLLIATSSAGWGALLLRWTPLQGLTTSRPALGDAGLIGLVFLAAMGQVLHFAVPLSAPLALATHMAGLLCLLTFRRGLFAPLSRLDLWFAAVTIVALFLQSLLDDPVFTAGIYYLQAIKWIVELPIIPGLGHLHDRLAFNSSQFILGALIKLPHVSWGSVFFLNMLFALFFLLALFQHSREALASDRPPSVSTLYAVVLLAGFCALPFYFVGAVGSLSSDFPPSVLLLYCVYLLVRWGEARESWALVLAFALASLALTIKLTAIPLWAGLVACAVTGLATRRVGGRARATIAAIAVAVLLPWLLRGVLLSGCWLFPEPWSCTSRLPWTVPRNLAINEVQFILHYARASDAPVLTLADWIAPALRGVVKERTGQISVLMMVVGLGLMARHLASGRTEPRLRLARTPFVGVVAACVPLAGILFLLVKGPAFRFSRGYWYALGSLILAWSLHVGGQPVARRWRRALPVTLCAFMATQIAFSLARYARDETKHVWPRIVPAKTTERLTASGLKVLVPDVENCADAPLPCTPFFDPTLRKVPLGDRFYLVGTNEEVDCCTFRRPGRSP